VADRVLHERLKHERWNEALHRRLLGVQMQSQPIAEPQALELQVGAHEVPLLAQGDLIDRLAVQPQPVTQQVAHALDRLLGERGFPPHQANERVQRV
jgi:hypothetical protein